MIGTEYARNWICNYEKYWGQGIASEAVEKIISFAKIHWGSKECMENMQKIIRHRAVFYKSMDLYSKRKVLPQTQWNIGIYV